MTVPFSFVHAADLHLDSPFRTLEVQREEMAQVFREATWQAFGNVIDLCLREQVDLLLVAGDVYDEANRSMRTQARFRDGLTELANAGIRTYVAHGNHDPLDGRANRLSYPPLVHVFGAEVDTADFVKDGEVVAKIHGVSYRTRQTTDNLAAAMRRLDGPAFQIGLLHCNLDGNAEHGPYAPCTSAELRAIGLDYWALGHVHRASYGQTHPPIAYPGNTQGRHVHELGPKGCLLVRVDGDGHASPTFVPTDAVRWTLVRAEILNLSTEQQLLDRIGTLIEAEVAAAGGRHLAARIRLEGRGPLYGALRAPAAAEDLLATLRDQWSAHSPLVWIDDVALRVQPELDLHRLAQESTFLSELLTGFAQARTVDLEAVRGWVGEALAAKGGRSRSGDGLADELTDELLLDIIDEAQALCLDQLVEDRG